MQCFPLRIVVLLSLSSGLALSACDSSRAPAPEASGEFTQAPDEIEDTDSHTFVGRWVAANEQAAAVAGNLTIGDSDRSSGALSFAFAHGVVVWAAPALLPRQDAEIRALLSATQERLGAPPSAFPVFYDVSEERVAMSAPRGGLCGGLRTRMIAVIALPPSPTDSETHARRKLRVVAFHTSTPSAETSDISKTVGITRIAPTALKDCFTFDYLEADSA